MTSSLSASSTFSLLIPSSREELFRLQTSRKRAAVARAQKSPFWASRLAGIRLDALEDPVEWSKIPLLDKETLRQMSDTDFYSQFCHQEHDGVAEYWRSGGSTGRPLFYPRSFADLQAAMVGFARTFACIGVAPGAVAHSSFPLGIHPAGQLMNRAAERMGIGVAWFGAGSTTASAIQLELLSRLSPAVWMGMSSYALHLASLALADGRALSSNSVRTLICSAEPLSHAKRQKIERDWDARVFDTFGMTEAGMMASEDSSADGFRVWTDLFFIEVLDPKTLVQVPEGEVGLLVVTPLLTNHITPFVRWLSGDLVRVVNDTNETGGFTVFPKLWHAHRTSGFFKVNGININHSDFEDLMFSLPAIGDFKCEAVHDGELRDRLRVSVEFVERENPDDALKRVSQAIKLKFEQTAELVVVHAGTLAREFEQSVKAPRFADLRPA